MSVKKMDSSVICAFRITEQDQKQYTTTRKPENIYAGYSNSNMNVLTRMKSSWSWCTKIIYKQYITLRETGGKKEKVMAYKMTYTKAADILEQHKDWGWNGQTTKAIDMAIELLRKEAEKNGKDR